MSTRPVQCCRAEIETIAAAVEGVVDTAAVLQDAGTPKAAIVAYVTPASVLPEAVLAACRARVPSHMVPSAVVGLDTMPRLPNGKVRSAAVKPAC